MGNLTLLSVPVLAGLLAAQAPITSPTGFLAIEGNSRIAHFDPATPLRYQQIDGSVRGTAQTLRGIRLRRDGAGGGPAATPRSVDVSLDLGTASFAIAYAEFDANHLVGTRATVVASRTLALPDLRPARGTPAPFGDFTLPFDQPYAYAGLRPLVIDLTYTRVVGGNGPVLFDAVSTSPTIVESTALGHGCTATGQSGPFSLAMRLEDHGPMMPDHSMRMRLQADRAPPSALIVLNIDVVDQALSHPMLCTTVHSFPSHALELGSADPTGRVAAQWLACPHMPSLIGVYLTTQMLALDLGITPIPVALSDGRAAVMPGSSNTAGWDVTYHAAAPTASEAELVFGAGTVIRLDT